MAGVLRLVANLPHLSGLPEDNFQNVWHAEVAGSDPAGADITDACSAVAHFYDTDVGAMADTIGSRMSEVIDRGAGACSVTAYFSNDLTGVTPFGSPIGAVTFTLPAAISSNQIPEEVAIVVSMNGDLTDVPVTAANPSPPPAIIRPQQRRRGRIFVGPLGLNAGEETASRFQPAAGFRTDLGLAVKATYNEIVANTPYVLAVWSKADAATYPIVAGYVDNAWDTQRRRGLDASTRTTFTI